MTKRSPVMVLVLCMVTCAIYELIWTMSTRNEMVERGADIPGNVFMFIPFANVWYVWKWSQGVEHVTKGAMSGTMAFLVGVFLGPIGAMMIQGKFNEVA